MGTDPIIDQTGYVFTLRRPVQRIVSLVPSQTELLFYLGLERQVVGVTRFCVHPATARSTRTVVGGTKNPDLQRILDLQPDLILGNKEENEQQAIETLRQDFPVWLSDVVSVEDACGMIRAVGVMTDTDQRAVGLENEIRLAFDTLPDFAGLKVVYLIWRNPYMAAGSHTFIHSLLEAAGFSNAVTHPRYPRVTLGEIRQLQPQVILLSSEPYPFSEKHIAEIRAAVPGVVIRLVDGEMFSWYGSRLLRVPGYFQDLFSTLMPTAARSIQKDGYDLSTT